MNSCLRVITCFKTISLGIIQLERPRIIMGPSRSFLNLFEPVTLTCTSTGIPTPSIRWYKDDVQLPSSSIVGQDLVFQETQLTDRGFYRCEAENLVGIDRSFRAELNFKSKLSSYHQYYLDGLFHRRC